MVASNVRLFHRDGSKPRTQDMVANVRYLLEAFDACNAPLWSVGLGLGLGFGRSFVWQPGGGPPRRGDNNEEGGRGRDAGNNTGRGNDDDESSADRRGTTSVHVGIGGGLFGGFGGLF